MTLLGLFAQDYFKGLCVTGTLTLQSIVRMLQNGEMKASIVMLYSHSTLELRQEDCLESKTI